MASHGRFPKARRLVRPAEFARVYALRSSAASGPLVLYARPRDATLSGGRGEASPPRLGVSVSRRIGNAVVRNHWKRRLREAFRVVQERLPAGSDLVVVVRSGRPPEGAAGAARVEEMLVALAARVTSRPGYAAAAAAIRPGPPPEGAR